MRIMILDEELPFPLNSGKRIRTSNLLTRLSSRHELTWIGYPNADAQEWEEAQVYYRDHGMRLVPLEDRLLPNRGVAFARALLRNTLASPLPYTVQKHARRVLRETVHKWSRSEQKIDLWHCEWTPYAEACCEGGVEQPWVVMAHNVESLIWDRMSRAAWKRPWKALFLKDQYRKYARFEKKVFSQCDRLITVSEEDAVLARNAFCAGEVQVVDNGVDIEFFHPGGKERDPRNLLFLGSLDWHPNIDAVELLASRLFPEIRRECPEATLTVVGRHPSEAMRKMLQEAPNVTLVPDAPDVRPYLWRCGMMVVPLRSGGGSRLKILEALATECPVVSTRIGAEGLRLESDQHLIVTESDRDFASRTVAAIASPEEMATMTAQGRKRVVEEYHWDVLADRLEAVWENTVSKTTMPTPPPLPASLIS